MEQEKDSFAVTLRVLNNDILGFSLESTSSKKNWIFFGCMTLITISVTASNLWPIIETLMNQ